MEKYIVTDGKGTTFYEGTCYNSALCASFTSKHPVRIVNIGWVEYLTRKVTFR